MPRDALWVLPSGATTVVIVDDEGNRIDTPPETEAPTAPADPQPRKKGPQRKQR